MGEKKLQEYNQGVYNTLRNAYPNLPDAEIQKKFDWAQKHSKKYYEDTTPFYRSGMAFARKWGKGTNEFFGDPRLPPEKTQADTIMNIAGGAVVPVPGQALLGPISKGVGAVAGKTAGKVAANVAEFATPVTFIPKGAGGGEIAARVGANIAIPAAVDQAVRAHKGDPSVVADTVNYATNLYDKGLTRDATKGVDLTLEINKKDDGSNTAATVGAAGFFATLLGARRLRNVPSGGPTSQAMSQAAYPTVNPTKMNVARAGSDVEPFRVVAKEQGLTNDEIDTFMTNTRMNAGNNPTADSRIWYSQRVEPVVDRFVREDPSFQEKFYRHIIDADRMRGDTDAVAKSNDLFIKAEADLQKATGPRGRSTPQRIQELTTERNLRRDEYNARIADSDPNLRYSMMNEDRATVQARLTQSRQDPRIRAVEHNCIVCTTIHLIMLSVKER